MKPSKTLGDWIAAFFCVMSDMAPLSQIVVLVVCGVVLGSVAMMVSAPAANESDEAHDARTRAVIHASVAVWSQQMHVEIDGISCWYGPISECDVHLTDGTRERLQCDRSGCATRDGR